MKSHFELLLLIAQKYSLLNVTAICFLGLLFDTYLKYSSQVQVLVRTCIKMCKMYTALHTVTHAQAPAPPATARMPSRTVLLRLVFMSRMVDILPRDARMARASTCSR